MKVSDPPLRLKDEFYANPNAWLQAGRCGRHVRQVFTLHKIAKSCADAAQTNICDGIGRSPQALKLSSYDSSSFYDPLLPSLNPFIAGFEGALAVRPRR